MQMTRRTTLDLDRYNLSTMAVRLPRSQGSQMNETQFQIIGNLIQATSKHPDNDETLSMTLQTVF